LVIVFTIVVPDPEFIEVETLPEVVLGGPPTGGEESGLHRATVGVPTVIPLDGAELGKHSDLFAFAQASGFDFYLVLLSCSLGVAPNETIRSARVSVDLAAGPEPSDADPTAWSMAPLRLVEKKPKPNISAGVEVSFSPMLKIKGDWASPEQEDLCYVHALGEGEPDPEWRYRGTTRDRLLGSHNMTMVVRATRGREASGSIRIDAEIGRPGLFRQRAAQLPEHVRQFTLRNQ
jgi:hypothetical protein